MDIVLSNMMRNCMGNYTDRDYVLYIHEQAYASNLHAFSSNSYTIQHSFTTSLPKARPRFELTRDKCVSIRDLTKSVDTVLGNKYFLCRTLTPPGKMSAMYTVVEDPAGKHAIRLVLYNYTNVPVSRLSELEKLMPVGSIIAILNPYYKTAADGGTAVRCDNPGDVIKVELDSVLLKDVVWKGSIPEKYSSRAVKLTRAKTVPDSAMACKLAGNNHFVSGKYQDALEMYENGLKLEPQNLDLLSNKCICYIKMEIFLEALDVADSVLKIDPAHLKVLYRKALALIGLKRYKEALAILETVQKKNDPLFKDINSLRATLKEQLLGVYDITYFMKQAENPKVETFPTCAEYLGPLKTVSVPGRGRGMAATEDIEAGCLLIVSKAFSFFKCENNLDITMDVNWDSRRISTSGSRTLISLAAKKIIANPELGKELYSLYAGPELGYLEPKKGHRCDLVDMNRIDKICAYNTFLNPNYKDKEGIKLDSPLISKGDSGIWIVPSYINHTCVDVNANWTILKDFMFIRAREDISVGQEILISCVSPMSSFKERMKFSKLMNFDCPCRLCTLEKSEPDEVHKSREKILDDLGKLPKTTERSRQTLVVLKNMRRTLERLRPDGHLDMALLWVEDEIGTFYLKIAEFDEAIRCYEKAYFLSVDFLNANSLMAVEKLLYACLAATKTALAKKWLPEFLEQHKIAYGPGKVIFMRSSCHTRAFIKSGLFADYDIIDD